MLENLLNLVTQLFIQFGTSPLFYLPVVIIACSWLFLLVWDILKGRYY